ncbi:hypothetical protein JOE58_000889 [Curtobacterium luteum]|uniref:Uncharacterized protein n=1 Tax=Curtobacterium luteum TaxID=33881 RepID=A0A8H9KXQ3_9MICO|nr:hypothetical protein [Curtobacterium luteum]MBM7801638.1 hypothetical protein [Curtobacterium luteum]NUU52040.1 hypothetical protein [Curtobacterium luteum]GGK88937.1 hypothetical protein GCM10009769_03660 [Curtobacterium luteum]
MTYSQPDPAEETTAGGAPEQPDTDDQFLEESGREDAALEIDADDVPTEKDDATEQDDSAGE